MTDLDPMLREAFDRAGRSAGAEPSLADVIRRSLRRSRRRLAIAAGAMVCAGLAATALVIPRDSQVSNGADQQAPSTTLSAVASTTTSNPQPVTSAATVYPAPTLTLRPDIVWYALWNARHDLSGVALRLEPPDEAATKSMPTPEQFDCRTDACRALFNYVEWHEIARLLGFLDVTEMQASNPEIDFSQSPHEGDVLQSSAQAASSASEGSSFTTSTVASTTSNP
ncbi:MAG: hypothetical protein QOE09_154 [Ilumatobacteraceae bacterium]|jgi:hypothetical protein